VERSKRNLAAVAGIVMAGVLSTWAPDAPAADAVETRIDTRDVTLVSGGIGTEEADALRAVASRYPLELVFARNVDGREEFLSDVRLTISDANGRVVVDRASGPIVLIGIPSGVYTVSAQFGGQVKTRRVAVGDGRHEKVSLVWSS
jgi:hypothetical protein